MIVTAPLLAQTTVLSVDSNGNVTANASLSAKAGVGGGTYTSGITATGSGTCTLTFTGGGGGRSYRNCPGNERFRRFDAHDNQHRLRLHLRANTGQYHRDVRYRGV